MDSHGEAGDAADRPAVPGDLGKWEAKSVWQQRQIAHRAFIG